MSPCHECLIIHNLEKRALTGPGIWCNGPPKARKYRKNKTVRRVNATIGTKVMESLMGGQNGKFMIYSKCTFYLAGLNNDGRLLSFQSNVMGSLRLLWSHLRHTTRHLASYEVTEGFRRVLLLSLTKQCTESTKEEFALGFAGKGTLRRTLKIAWLSDASTTTENDPEPHWPLSLLSFAPLTHWINDRQNDSYFISSR